jgi:hypothetical protein
MINAQSDRASVIQRYQAWFEDRLKTDAEFKQRIESLKGKTLGCFCKPQACHGDVIAAYVNSL